MAQRIDQGKQREKGVSISVNGVQVISYPGETVATALLCADFRELRTSPNSGEPRGPYCLMGSCQECLVRIDGKLQLACQIRVSEGMAIEIEFAHE
jgi:predicted molibdopterin-dependent oxidoreductase YjgC